VLQLVLFILLLPLALILTAIVMLGDGITALLVRARRFVAAHPTDGPRRHSVQPLSPLQDVSQRDVSQASIIIVNWNGRDLLAQGLPSVLAAVARDGGHHEVIVVDNGSNDGSADFVQAAFPTVKLVRLEHNLGFGAGNNIGVQVAQKDIVILLNNDMVVDPDFLPPLLRPFADERVFAVSSQIVMDAAGRQVETGLTRASIDGGCLSAWHASVPTGDKAIQPCLWAGGGSSAFDRQRFLALGGFDSLYAPFYVEDLDLSYRAWKRGWTVLFAPDSVVYHRHRASTSRFGLHYVEQAFAKNCRLFVWRNITDWRWIAASMLRLPGDLAAAIGSNRVDDRHALVWALRQLPAALRRRWMGAICAVYPSPAMQSCTPTDRHLFQVACSRYHYKECFDPPPALPVGGRKKILMVCPYLPVPPTHGGAVRMLNLIRNLSLTNDVDVLSFLDTEDERDAVPQLTPYCRRLHVVVRRPRSCQNPLRDRSWYIEEFDTPEMHEALLKMISDEDYHVLQFEYTQMALYHPGTRRSRTVLDEVDVMFRSFHRQHLAGRRFPRRQAIVDYLKLVRFEVESCRHFDHILAMSAADAACLMDYLPERRHTIVEIANGVDTDYYTPPTTWPGGCDLLFVGSYRHTPNREGIIYFVRQVLPLIQREIPQVRLLVVGDGPWAEIDDLAANPCVTVTGFVEDTRPYLASCAVSIVPILSGAGTRIKILEALAAAIPVISTTLGCEGIEARPGEDILIADTPAEFAAATVKVLRDHELAEKLRRNGRRLVEDKYNWRAIVARLDRLYTLSLRPGAE